MGIRFPRKKKKVVQMIWLEPAVMAKVLEIADKANVAPNVVIAEIVKRYFAFNPEPIKTVEVEKEVKIVKPVCPACLKEFDSVAEVRDHITKSDKCWKEIKAMKG